MSLSININTTLEIYNSSNDLWVVIVPSGEGKYAISICRRVLGNAYKVLVMSWLVIKSREDAVKMIRGILEKSRDVWETKTEREGVLKQSRINEIIRLLETTSNSVYTSKDGLLLSA